MAYGVKETPKGFEILVESADRAGLFRDALSAAAGLASPAAAVAFEGSLPLQAAGETDEELLRALIAELLREAPLARGTVGPPRWILFEPGRVTATLSLAPGEANARPLELSEARLEPGRASIVLTNGRHQES